MICDVDLRPNEVFWVTGYLGWSNGLICYVVALARAYTDLPRGRVDPEYALQPVAKDESRNLPRRRRSCAAYSATCLQPVSRKASGTQADGSAASETLQSSLLRH